MTNPTDQAPPNREFEDIAWMLVRELVGPETHLRYDAAHVRILSALRSVRDAERARVLAKVRAMIPRYSPGVGADACRAIEVAISAG